MAIDFVPLDKGSSDGIDFQPIEQPQASGPNPYVKAASDYLMHPLIEGGAMTLGGSAGGIVGSAAGPVGTAVGGIAGAASMYGPAHQFANAIDQNYLGIPRKEGGGTIPQQVGQSFNDFGTGLGIEAGNAALKPVLGVAGKLLPGAKTGEALSGTPAANLSRAYKQGFWDTYVSPKPLAKAGEEFGAAKTKLMEGYMTPEDQAQMLVSPRGEANQKISDVYTKWLKGEPIGPQDAVAAKTAIDTVYPNGAAKNAPRIAKFNEFKSALSDMIGQQAPDFKQANDNYAASKLRSQLMKPARVNSSNPDNYSKLSAIIMENLGGIGSGFAHSWWPALGATGTVLGSSPLAMGLVSSGAGSIANAVSRVSDPARRALISAYLQNRSNAGNQNQTSAQ